VTSLDAIRHSPSFSEAPAKPQGGRFSAAKAVEDDDGPLRLLTGGPVSDIVRAACSADEGTAAGAQFGVRSSLRRREGQSVDDSYAYLLDEDAPQKIRAILATTWVSPEALTRLLYDAFADISDRWLALQVLVTERDTLDAHRQAALDTVLAQAQDVPADAVRERKAGIHCAIKARLTSVEMRLEYTPAMLRATYRSFLSSDAPDIEVYQSWIAGFGYERRALVLQFVEGALVDDMQSADPSCTPTGFLTPLARLGILRRLRSCERTFVAQVSQSPHAAPFNSREEDWLHFVLAVLTDPATLDESMREVTGSAALLHDNGAHGRLIGLLHRACSALPGEPLQTPQAREALLDGLRLLAGSAYRGERSDGALDPVSRHRRSV
jgi:type III secretion protein W